MPSVSAVHSRRVTKGFAMPTTIQRPTSTEYLPYYDRYIARVPEGDVLELLRGQMGETAAALGGLDERGASHRYAEGKWSVKQMAGHMADTERVFAYRAMCIARGDTQPLPGFDENAYVERATFDARPIADLVAELRAVREATVRLFAPLGAEELARRGVANGAEVTVRALAYIIAGHERHHLTLFRERYLPGIR